MNGTWLMCLTELGETRILAHKGYGLLDCWIAVFAGNHSERGNDTTLQSHLFGLKHASTNLEADVCSLVHISASFLP